MIPAKRRRERLAVRVSRTDMLPSRTGVLVPADSYASKRMREKGFRTGDLLFAEFVKPRNPGFHGLAHRIGQVVAANIESFSGKDPHEVLKRLQYEGDIGCEHVVVVEEGVERVIRWPKTIAFEQMDQGEFHEIVRAFCRYISTMYWPDLDERQIEEMAAVFVGED